MPQECIALLLQMLTVFSCAFGFTYVIARSRPLLTEDDSSYDEQLRALGLDVADPASAGERGTYGPDYNGSTGYKQLTPTVLLVSSEQIF